MEVASRSFPEEDRLKPGFAENGALHAPLPYVMARGMELSNSMRKPAPSGVSTTRPAASTLTRKVSSAQLPVEGVQVVTRPPYPVVP